MQETIDTAVAGGGFVYYEYHIPTDTDPVEMKTSYATYIKEWDWVVVSSTYQFEFNSGATAIMQTLVIALIAALLIGLAVTYLLAKNISSPLKKLTLLTEQVAHGDLASNVEKTTRHDEVGRLHNHFVDMVRFFLKLLLFLLEYQNKSFL